MAEIRVDASLGPNAIITLDGSDVRQHLGGGSSSSSDRINGRLDHPPL
jgi:hypothetical protein